MWFLKQWKNNDKEEGTLLKVCQLVNMNFKLQKVQVLNVKYLLIAKSLYLSSEWRTIKLSYIRKMKSKFCFLVLCVGAVCEHNLVYCFLELCFEM